MRICIICVGGIATLIAIVVNSIYALFVLCGDLVYVVAFPQLTSVVYVPFSNTYGSAVGYILAFFLRVTGGEPLIGLPPLIKYPNFHEASQNQLFPFKTMSVLISLAAIIGVSYVTDLLFKRHILSPRFDIFNCFPELTPNEVKEYSDGLSNQKLERIQLNEDLPTDGDIIYAEPAGQPHRRRINSDPRRQAETPGENTQFLQLQTETVT